MAAAGMTATLTQWPALYDPRTEVRHLEGKNATQPNGRYLYDPHGPSTLRSTH
jgi:hypothetical protein